MLCVIFLYCHMEKNFKGEDLKLAALTKYNYKERLHFQVWSVPSCSGGVRAIKAQQYSGVETLIFCWAEIPSRWESYFVHVFFLPILTIFKPGWVCIISRQKSVSDFHYFWRLIFIHTHINSLIIFFFIWNTIVINDLSHMNWDRILLW